MRRWLGATVLALLVVTPAASQPPAGSPSPPGVDLEIWRHYIENLRAARGTLEEDVANLQVTLRRDRETLAKLQAEVAALKAKCP